MPYKDPEKQRQANRENMRKARAGTTAEKRRGTRKARLKTAEDVRRLVARVLNEVEAEDTDRLASARVVARLADVILKCIEQGNIEERLERIEEALRNGEIQDKGR